MAIHQLAAAWSRTQEVAAAALNASWESYRLPGDSDHYVDQLEAAHEKASAAAERIAETIAGLQPLTIAEAATKFKILLEHYGDGHGGLDQPGPVFAFLADLDRLAELGIGGSEPATVVV